MMLPFGAGSDGRERNAAAILIDIDDPDLQHVADADHFVRIVDVPIGQPADVHQAAIGQADIDEDAEIDDVQHRARKLHAGRQILELHDAAAEDRRGQAVARIDRRAAERHEDVVEQMRADAEFRSDGRNVELVGPIGDDVAGGSGGLGARGGCRVQQVGDREIRRVARGFARGSCASAAMAASSSGDMMTVALVGGVIGDWQSSPLT